MSTLQTDKTMSLNAQRHTADSSMGERYHVGNYHIAFITKEQYEEIKAACGGKEYGLREGCYIVYMHDASRAILAKYSKIVRENPMHSSKSAKEIRSKISSLQSDLNAIEELEELMREPTEADCFDGDSSQLGD